LPFLHRATCLFSEWAHASPSGRYCWPLVLAAQCGICCLLVLHRDVAQHVVSSEKKKKDLQFLKRLSRRECLDDRWELMCGPLRSTTWGLKCWPWLLFFTFLKATAYRTEQAAAYNKGLFRCTKNPKLYKILHHIESCGTCMKY